MSGGARGPGGFSPGSPLGLDAEALNTCVSCGLCLPHCPTWRATGDEVLSPRGRIAAMRQVESGVVSAADDAFARSVQTCVMCRGCEPACPSAVPFGELMGATRSALARGARRVPWWQRLGYRVLGHHRIVLAGSSALGVAQRARLVPAGLSRRLGLPARIPVRRPRLAPTGNDVWLFTGCVMDAWQRDVHADAAAVLAAMGVGVALPASGASCCGALHEHAGLTDAATELARRTMEAMPGDAPILVDSAGCGAALLAYGDLVGSPEAARFSARVRDISAWIAERSDRLPPRRHLGARIAVQDPCHLRHVQRDHLGVRRILAGVGELVELDDDGLCCGAGGAYSALQPALAGTIRDRKLAVLGRARPDVVASANPGCSLHLAAAGVRVAHPVSLLARSVALGEPTQGPVP